MSEDIPEGAVPTETGYIAKDRLDHYTWKDGDGVVTPAREVDPNTMSPDVRERLVADGKIIGEPGSYRWA